MPEDDKLQTNWVAVQAGHPFTVTKLGGKTESVNIKAVDVTNVESVLEKMKNTTFVVETLTGKKGDWLKQLEPPSFYALYEEILRVNLPLFQAYKSGMERAGKLLQEGLGSPGDQSQSGSQTSP